MRAITIEVGRPGSTRLEDLAVDAVGEGSVLVEAVAVGICGTDEELMAGDYGWAPPGRARLVLGHESLGRVIDPGDSGLRAGDLVVGIVRRPDPVPCASCAVGEWDMCRNGQYTERGIKALDGFMAERWRIEPGFAVRVDPAVGLRGVLLEPASILAKAWDHVRAVGERATWRPRRALVTGTGPIGLLGALFAVQHGLDVHVLGRRTEGLQPDLVRALGATYHTGRADALGIDPDVVIEATGAPSVVVAVLRAVAPSGVVCLTGIGGAAAPVELDVSALNDRAVLGNVAAVGVVNANRRHHETAAEALRRADPDWLDRLITRQVPLEAVPGLTRRRGDVKVVVRFGETAAADR